MRLFGWEAWWAGRESNPHSRKTADLQSAELTTCSTYPRIRPARGASPAASEYIERRLRPQPMEPRVGVEPTTVGLQNRCSAIELPRRRPMIPVRQATPHAPGGRYCTRSARRRASRVSSTLSSTVVSIALTAPPPPIAIATGGHRHVVGCLPQGHAVMLAERIPEAMERPADGFDVRPRRIPTILRILDEPPPGLGRIAESRQVHRHGVGPPRQGPSSVDNEPRVRTSPRGAGGRPRTGGARRRSMR